MTMQGFADLPDALVRDLLATAIPVADGVANTLNTLRAQRSQLREEARTKNLIQRKADLDIVREPSVVGIDGSYQIHRLTSVDLTATAAVAVEGTSREARKHWPEPYHQMWVNCLPHSIDTVGGLRGMMISMELALAHQAPHDLVLLDGSFSSLIIYLNQALTKIDECAPALATEFLGRWRSGVIQQLKQLLRSDHTVAMPKFTSRNELTSRKNVSPSTTIDGKTLATLILEPGEYTTPIAIHSPDDPPSLQIDHLPVKYCPKPDMDEIAAGLHTLNVIYYRPYGWIPALRLEASSSITSSKNRLSLALEGITRQFLNPAVLEPYPLFLADRMVKSLGAGVEVIEQAVAQHVVGESADIETTMLFLQNYRTEGGRGG